MTMKLNLPRLAAAAIVLLAAQGCWLPVPVLGQTTGVAHPEDLPNDINSPPPAPAPPPITAPVAAPAASQHYVEPTSTDHYVEPSDNSANSSADTSADSSDDDDAATAQPAYPSPAPALSRRDNLTTPVAANATQPLVVTNDINSGVVTEVPVGPNELPIGTVIWTELQDTISTRDTPVGSRFTATLTNDVDHNRVVLLPAGAVIAGRVTRIHEGHAIGGPAAIRLQPDTVTLPDGTTYRIDAEVIDLDRAANSHVNGEGTIEDNVHPKTTLAVLGGATGVAAVSGAAVAGPVGAAVGAGIGAGVGAAWWLRHERQETLPQGTSIVFCLNNSLQLTPKRQ